MMLEILANTAVRILLLGAATWLTVRIIRVRNPHVEVLVWRMVLLAGLVDPGDEAGEVDGGGGVAAHRRVGVENGEAGQR